MVSRGKFFAIEGGDGSGKGTQTAQLMKQLQSEGRDVLALTFPRYGHRSAKIVEQYLRGEFGAANDVAPQLASTAFALDRVAAKYDLEQWLAKHPDGIAISDRYVLSNLAHQGTKIIDTAERHAFYQDSLEIEFGDLRLPKPDKNIILLVPTDVAQANVDKKTARSYTTDKRDIHERDADHLTLANRNYREIAELYPDFAVAIEVYDYKNQRMRPIDDIKTEIRTIFGI
ncbi:MAG: dTMP kinase [Acidobacteriota bacterium]